MGSKHSEKEGIIAFAEEAIILPTMQVSEVLNFVGIMFGLNLGVLLLVLWRVEVFLKRTLVYIKAGTAFGAESILTPQEKVPPAPEGEAILRSLQDEAYQS